MIKNSDQKKIGSYYTPQLLSDFIIFHLFDRDNYSLPAEISLMEPSAGDGMFFGSIFNNNYFADRLTPPDKVDVWAVERDADAIKAARQNMKTYAAQPHSIRYINQDYLDYHQKNKKKFDLIVGNPPYIKSNYLTSDQLAACEKIHKESGLSNKKIKNIWTSFLVGGAQSLNDNGIMAFVLPAELLQVIYAKELRDLLRDSFQKIEIFTFNELIFEDIEQDVIVLICAKNQQPGVSFYHVDKLEDLKQPDYTKDNSNIHRETLDKWTNYILSDDDFVFLDGLKDKMKLSRIDEYARSVTGIVTAANDFLITDRKTVEQYGLGEIAHPILKKSSHLPVTAKFTAHDLEAADKAGLPTSFLAFDDEPSTNFPDSYKAYLRVGEDRQLDQRYKMKLRDNWYAVPLVWEPEGFFIKRSNIFPRMVINEAGALVTDSFYRVTMKEGYRIQDLVFSFYNTITFIYAELEGRYYGGSVLELTPSEFKGLTLPYVKNVSDKTFKGLDKLLRQQASVTTILNFSDQVILRERYKLSAAEVSKLRVIYEKLVRRRLKRHLVNF